MVDSRVADGGSHTNTHVESLGTALPASAPARRFQPTATISETRCTISIFASGRAVYLSRDPREEAGGHNIYAFVANRAMVTLDAFGLSACSFGSKCEQLNSALVYAQLAKAVYTWQTPPGWTLVDGYNDMDSGLQVGVYRGPDGQFVAAFRGTEPTSLTDWQADVQQGIGGGSRSDQYDLTAQGADMKAWVAKYPKLTVTGHSLGGGLASLYGGKYSLCTTTFNAAGLNDDTLKFANTSRDATDHYTTAYQVRGDILTTGLQGLHLADKSSGQIVKLSPDVSAKDLGTAWGIGLIGGGSLGADALALMGDLHGMDEVIESLEKAKACACK